MRGTWWLVGALLVVATGCGDQPSGGTAAAEDPVASPTSVPGASGTVATSQQVLVSDDGSGVRMCSSGISDLVGPPTCDAYTVTGWDWARVPDSEVQDGVRWGSYRVVGTFDGSTFAVEEATRPDPEPDEWDFEIPCPTPEGGWQVADPDRTTQDAMLGIGRLEEEVPGFAMVAVSTSSGEPGPRDPLDTVVSLYVAGDPAAAETIVRRSWGGMLCVTEVEHSHAELARIQKQLLDVPGTSEVGSGNADNQVEVTVFHDDGSIQRWADQEYGEGVVVVESILQPVG